MRAKVRPALHGEGVRRLLGVAAALLLAAALLEPGIACNSRQTAVEDSRSRNEYRRFVLDAEEPLERALADFDAAVDRDDDTARRDPATRALSAARQARDRLEARVVHGELEVARREELLFLNHVVPAFQAYVETDGTPADLAKLRSILARGRTHQRLAREALGQQTSRQSEK